MKRILGLLPLLILLLADTGAADSPRAVFETASRSTVVVLARDLQGNPSLGTGVVLPFGGIATNCHIIQGSSSLRVRYAGREYPAFRRLSRTERDVCTLEAPALEATPALLGNSELLAVGERVYAIGTPHGLELTLSEGIVSGFRADKTGRYIQTTAPVSPGSSGGGLFDESGRLVGLMTFTIETGQNLNFAIPVEWIVDLVEGAGSREPSALRIEIQETEDGRRTISITD